MSIYSTTCLLFGLRFYQYLLLRSELRASPFWDTGHEGSVLAEKCSRQPELVEPASLVNQSELGIHAWLHNRPGTWYTRGSASTLPLAWDGLSHRNYVQELWCLPDNRGKQIADVQAYFCSWPVVMVQWFAVLIVDRWWKSVGPRTRKGFASRSTVLRAAWHCYMGSESQWTIELHSSGHRVCMVDWRNSGH